MSWCWRPSFYPPTQRDSEPKRSTLSATTGVWDMTNSLEPLFVSPISSSRLFGTHVRAIPTPNTPHGSHRTIIGSGPKRLNHFLLYPKQLVVLKKVSFQSLNTPGRPETDRGPLCTKGIRFWSA